LELYAKLQLPQRNMDSGLAFNQAGIARYLSRACYARAKSRLIDADSDYANKVFDYETAISIDPNYVTALRDLAWLRATCMDKELRNPKRAVELATIACDLTDWKDHESLSLFASACSEAEEFADAIKWQQKAIELLPVEGTLVVKGDYAKRLHLYQSNTPYTAGELWSFKNGRIVAFWDFNDVEDDIVKNCVASGPHANLIGGAKTVVDSDRGNVLSLSEKGSLESHQSDDFVISGSISVSVWIKTHQRFQCGSKHVQCMVDRLLYPEGITGLSLAVLELTQS